MTDWPQVVRQYGPVVWKTAVRLLRNNADAEDCFQATFLSAWQISQTQEIRCWPGLLKQVATRRALELLRQQARNADCIATEHPEVLVDRKVEQPEVAAAANEIAERLRLAIACLEPRQAEVFCLARMEGMSYADIAERLALSVNHVGVLLNRARSALRQHLSDAFSTTAKEVTKEADA